MRNETIKLYDWRSANPPGEHMLWRNDFIDYTSFWGNDMLPLFDDISGPVPPADMDGLNSFYDSRAINVNNIHEIIGTHISKSIVNPVVLITYKGYKIAFRYNFFGYEVYVEGDHWLTIPQKDIFKSMDARFFYQGFPEEYTTDLRYEHGRRKFMVAIADHHRFFAFMVTLRNEVDRLTGSN